MPETGPETGLLVPVPDSHLLASLYDLMLQRLRCAGSLYQVWLPLQPASSGARRASVGALNPSGAVNVGFPYG